MDPFIDSSTIAKLALTIYRRNFLQPNVIINAPEGGYRRQQTQSIVALEFLKCYELIKNEKIQTTEWKCGEASFNDSGIRVDGFIKKKNLILEFYGCYFHGKLKFLTNIKF